MNSPLSEQWFEQMYQQGVMKTEEHLHVKMSPPLVPGALLLESI